MSDIDVLWPFIVWLCIGYTGLTVALVSLLVHVQRNNKRIDENHAEWAAWAVGVTNKINQIGITRDGPPTPNMKNFAQLVKDEEENPTNLD